MSAREPEGGSAPGEEPEIGEGWLTALVVFGQALEGRGYARNTSQAYVRGSRALLSFLAARGHTPTTLTATDLQEFRQEVHGTHRQSAAMTMLAGARLFLRQLADEGRCRPEQVLPSLNCGPRRAAPALPPILGAAASELDRAMRAAGLANDTRTIYTRVWRDFLRYLTEEQGIEDLVSVSREVVTGYRLSLQTRLTARGTPYASSSQKSAVAALRFLFTWLVRTGQLVADPTRHLRLPRAAQTLPRVPSTSDVVRVLRASPKSPAGLRDRAALELLYGTGLRGGELVRLDLGDVDLAQRLVLVREGKGRQDRLVPLGSRARAALVAYLERGRPALLWHRETPAVFVVRGGARLSRGHLCTRVRRLAARRGIALRPHLLRHACATHLLKGRADIRHIQRLLGHKSLSTTERYTRVEISDLRAVVRRCHPRERDRR